jgi:glucose-6-phosphate 1-dehydrogenase
VTIGVGALVKRPGEAMCGEPVELIARHQSRAEMSPYERLLGNAIHGDTTLFTRDDCVEAAWAVVEPILDPGQPPVTYEPGTWGPSSASDIMHGGELWHDLQPEKPPA